jgi:hypothetical protein
MPIAYRDNKGLLLAGLRISGGTYRPWANLAVLGSFLSILLGAADEISRQTTGISTGFGGGLARTGLFSALALWALERLPPTRMLVRNPTEPPTPSPQ